MKRATLIVVASLLGFLALEALIFRTGLYIIVADANTTSGYMGQILHNEAIRVKENPYQILAIGDSRLALMARVANDLKDQTGYTYGSIAVPGTTPRCWYYMLREADPDANRYRAIVIGMDSYEDPESYEIYDRESDLNYVLDLLRYSDIQEFSGSYKDKALQARARRGILLKGLVLKRDFQGLLLNPWARVRDSLYSRKHSHQWIYEYDGVTDNMVGLEVDWEKKTLKLPPGTSAAVEAGLKQRLLEPTPEEMYQDSAYLKHWFGRIYDHYRNSATKLVFVRLPRAPWIRPDLRPLNPDASVRLLAREPNVVLVPDEYFNVLETPELFRDQMHLNREGLHRFTTMLAKEMPRLIEPPR